MRYAELHCKSNFSFLTGASHPDELAVRAAELGYAALAITDRESLAGIVRAHVAAQELGFKLVVGAEIHPTDAAPVVLWTTDRKSYGRLCRLLTVGRRRAPKGTCRLNLADIAEYSTGLIAGVSPGEDLHTYRDIFSDRTYLLAELLRGPDDSGALESLRALSQQSRVPLVAAGDVHYHSPARQPLHEVLTATRLGTPVDRLAEHRFVNAQRHLRSLDEIARMFHRMPEAVRRTVEIANRCPFNLTELKYEYPEELVPQGLTASDYLARLTWQGADERYPGGVPDKVRQLIEHELRLIAELRYEAYFLTVYDLVRFARSQQILCQGRGSAANSAVCYCLGITSVDPDRIDVLFERFISAERAEAPDIDVDFEHERREEVLQYLYQKYGPERAGMTAVVITYRVRSAIRDVGKALGLSLDKVDALAKHLEGRELDRAIPARPKTDQHEDPQPGYAPLHAADVFPRRCAEVGIDPSGPLGRRLIHLVRELIGFPRHLSQHVGGMVLTRGPLCELVPLENAAMPGRVVAEWDKDDLDALGILKVDCLCLGMLTAIRKCFALLEKHHGHSLTLASVPAEDSRVYDMLCRADTIGVFQVESRAQMSMLPRLKPRCFYDIVIEVAIIRPGPIQGGMVHPYLRRRAGTEPVPPYPTPEIEAVLEKTKGVPLFQEQVMRLAQVAAGFSAGEADQLRRAMAAWRRTGDMERFHQKLIDGMTARGLTKEFAEQVFSQIRGFSEYGFPESHASSFSLLVYCSAYLKCFYPAAFCAALLNSQPMGFYAPAQLIRDAKEHGVGVRPIDVNRSEWDCILEEGSLRLGFRLLKGVPQAAVERIVTTRPFHSMDDFARRTQLSRPLLSRLGEADVFGSLQLDRRTALWQSLAQHREPRPLFVALDDEEAPTDLPPMSPADQVLLDYRTSGFSLKNHPISFFRGQLDKERVTRNSELKALADGRRIRVAGMVLMRQRPGTAKGITFVTLEDETGIANLVVRPAVWDRYYAIARCSSAWIAHGVLESRESVIHLLVNRLEDLATRLGHLEVRSRDFH
jgi:error-prone DNA polymerase